MFTDKKRAGIWIKKKPFPYEGIVAFIQLGMNATVLFRKFKGAPSSAVFVINPLSEDERVLTHEELQVLAAL